MIQIYKLTIIITLIILSGCGKPLSKGADDELIVVTALEDRADAVDILGHIFNDTLFTPAPEPYYKITFVKPDALKKVRHHPNLIIISIGDDLTNPGTRMVKKILPERSYFATKTGQENLILANDVYAKMQTVLVISGAEKDEIIASATIQAEKIYAYFDKQFKLRQSRFLFQRARKHKLEVAVFKKHGFGLQIPWGYTVIVDSAEANLFWIGREDPFRWIAVHWQDGLVVADQSTAADYTIDFPQRIFGHIRYAEYKFDIEKVLFKHWSGWRVTGLWESIEAPQGGPFIAYVFYDGVTDRTYYIHTMIYNPGENKYLMLRQLDIIAETFYVDKITV